MVVQPHSILVVEDDDDILAILRLQLEDNLYTVYTATCYDEALHIIQNKHIDTIISDFCLPGKNGYRIYDYVNENQLEHIQFVLISGSDLDEVYSAKHVPFTFIRKPLTFDALIECFNPSHVLSV